MLLEVLQLLINSLFFNLKTIVVSYFDLCSLASYLVDQLLVLGIDHFDVFDPSQLHLSEQLVALVDQLDRLLAVLLQLPDNLLSIFLEHVNYRDNKKSN